MKIRRIFFDANIFNDIFDENRVHHNSSKESLLYALQNDIRCCTSCDIVTNIYYITAKYTSKNQALDALDYLKEIVEIIPFSYEELTIAIDLMKRDGEYKDMEDTIQYILAIEQHCDLIISNDKRFVSKEIECVSSDDFANSRR
ncbi:MAG: PIN domain-containing protein [Campylobacterota bacterium]|nr:PIN domain-containing protein [Campylobacterota bacterium]